MAQKHVPFYSNTPDDMHCYQAALKMVLKYFRPERKYSWKELDKLTGQVKNLWTWPTQGLINLHKIGFNIIFINDFNVKKFIKDGGKYLIKRYGEEVGNGQIKNSDIEEARKNYEEFLKLKLYKQNVPSLDDIKRFLDDGYLVVCNVNYFALNNKPGYTGHFVVVYDYDKKYFTVHDPGLPPQEARKVSYKNFIKAWEYPNEAAKNIIALKLENTSNS